MARTIFTTLFILATFGAGLAWFSATMPNPLRIKGCMVTEMYNVNLCDKNSTYVRLSNISRYVKDVIVISEDASFYHHNGFDWFELKNSLRENLQEHGFSRGGSTITQQLAKNVFLTGKKTLGRKLREAYLTFQIERILSKQEILEKYLNVVEFGPNIYGVGPAAKKYFKKSAADLNLLESAYLAYLLPNPKLYSRIFDKGANTKFSRYRLLDLNYKMYRFGRISEEQYLAAKNLIDRFPWSNLDSTEIAALDGNSTSGSTEEIPEEPLAESVSQQKAPEAPEGLNETQEEAVNEVEAEDATAAAQPSAANPPTSADNESVFDN